MKRSSRTLILFSVLALATAAHAQSLEAFQGLYVGPGDGSFVATDGNGGANDASDPFTVTRSFTGLDGSGGQQTMTVSGSAYSSASYGKIHIFGEGTVTNSYYNSSNPSVIDGSGNFNPDGSPDLIGLHGNAGWSDTVTYTGFQGTGYLVKYYFALEGAVSGDTEAGLNFSTSAANAPSYNPRTTRDHEIWATPDYQLLWDVPFTIDVDFYAGLTTYTSQYPDGSTLSGYADYADTLTLTGIEITDAMGRPVTGWSVTSASGTTYPVQAIPTPEPASLAALGVGALALARRRRRV